MTQVGMSLWNELRKHFVHKKTYFEHISYFCGVITCSTGPIILNVVLLKF